MLRHSGVMLLISSVLIFAGCKQKISTKDNCGDGIVDPGENCDGVNLNGQTCQTQGYYLPTTALGCTAECTFDLSGCGGSYCGNGIADDPEDCEGTQLRGETCTSQGWYTGTLACAESCEYDFSGCGGQCGDSVVQDEFLEQCDPAGFEDTCRTLGFWTGEASCVLCELDVDACLSAMQVSLRHKHACALDSQGAIWCWGDNEFGQLGNGTLGGSASLPQLVQAPEAVSFTRVTTAAEHTCALDTEGMAWCWGSNAFGMLGNYDSQVVTSAVPVAVLMPGTNERFASISSMNHHTCALNLFGTAFCWGNNNYGQIGTGTIGGDVPLPTEVMMPAAGSFVHLSVGSNHTCAVAENASVFCWGLNSDGQLGDGNTALQAAPTLFSSSIAVASVSAGATHSCALQASGEAWCWGRNDFGQLGANHFIDTKTPTAVLMPAGRTFTTMALGTAFSCALDDTGTAWCWGADFNGALGNATGGDTPVPVQVDMPVSVPFSSLSCGFYGSCATGSGGSLWCWGNNDRGQLGNGTDLNTDAPVQVPEP